MMLTTAFFILLPGFALLTISRLALLATMVPLALPRVVIVVIILVVARRGGIAVAFMLTSI